MQLTKNFSLEELTKSETAIRLGISNAPSEEEIKNLHALCENVLQPLREHYDLPIVFNSGFRCADVNHRIGGSSTSQHVKGMAADFIIPSIDLKKIYKTIADSFEYDQLIYEFGSWIHVSFSAQHNRKQNLIATKNNSVTVYKSYNGEFV